MTLVEFERESEDLHRRIRYAVTHLLELNKECKILHARHGQAYQQDFHVFGTFSLGKEFLHFFDSLDKYESYIQEKWVHTVKDPDRVFLPEDPPKRFPCWAHFRTVWTHGLGTEIYAVFFYPEVLEEGAPS